MSGSAGRTSQVKEPGVQLLVEFEKKEEAAQKDIPKPKVHICSLERAADQGAGKGHRRVTIQCKGICGCQQLGQS